MQSSRKAHYFKLPSQKTQMQQFKKLVDGIIYTPDIDPTDEWCKGANIIVTDAGKEYLLISLNQMISFINAEDQNACFWECTKEKHHPN